MDSLIFTTLNHRNRVPEKEDRVRGVDFYTCEPFDTVVFYAQRDHGHQAGHDGDS